MVTCVCGTILTIAAFAVDQRSEASDIKAASLSGQREEIAEIKPSEKAKDEVNPEKKVRSDWAEIHLKGTYPEGTQMPGLFGDLVESLSVCLDRLQQAGRDKSIKGVLLRINDLEIGWARLNEIQTAIQQLRKTGKPVWAYVESGGNKEYLVASSCDRILMPESGTLMLTGLRAEVTFYKNLLKCSTSRLRCCGLEHSSRPQSRIRGPK